MRNNINNIEKKSGNNYDEKEKWMKPTCSKHFFNFLLLVLNF